MELDTPGGGDGGDPKTYTYTGKGGVPVGSLWNRLLYAAKFGDVNMLLSDRVNSASKIIYDRTPRERVEKAAPWLTVDGDAYPAVVEGRIVWIVDGYTTSNSYPYSNRVALNEVTADAQTNQGTVAVQARQDVNYIRNSVKAVVDSYDGTVKLYAWDEEDPVLQTWRKAFPTVVQPKSAISADLLDHLRYPQDLFKVQRQVLGRYHVTNPDNWYQNTSLWEIPKDPIAGATSNTLEPPFYLSIKWPGTGEPSTFSLTTAFVPKNRSNLAAYFAVNADASSPRVRPAAGAADVRQQPDRRARAVVQRHDDQREGGRSAAPVPESRCLKRCVRQPADPAGRRRPALRHPGLHPAAGQHRVVSSAPVRVVRFGQEVGIGDTLQQALDEVFGESGAKTGEGGDGDGSAPAPTGQADNTAASQALDQAEKAFTAADKALTTGDLATYQTKIKEAEAAVQRALKALGR